MHIGLLLQYVACVEVFVLMVVHRSRSHGRLSGFVACATSGQCVLSRLGLALGIWQRLALVASCAFGGPAIARMPGCCNCRYLT
jgi:hypothetical protein